ncbi:transcription factor Adf-1-like [Anastrepha ludens]|uniref:transcription factor Adf-1-like n=1 Tax=Anastrepha ludens TaxID=28586 RepID=UPI0023B10D5D|nr:transcription factor Adf-1-like [Anastrepha ludens]
MSEVDINQIISEIFSRPALWDQKNKLYHNRVCVEKLWTSVVAEIKVPKEDLKKKWKYLRDQFRSELRKFPTPKSGDADDTASQITSTWPYFQSLLFLKDQMKYRNLSGNLKPGKFKKSQVEEYENEDVHNTSQFEESEEMYESFETNPESCPKRKRTANSSSAELLEIEKKITFA